MRRHVSNDCGDIVEGSEARRSSWAIVKEEHESGGPSCGTREGSYNLCFRVGIRLVERSRRLQNSRNITGSIY